MDNFKNHSSTYNLSIDRPARSGGKKVFDWTFSIREYKGDLKIPVEVHLFMDKEDRAFFRATSPKLATAIEDSDIQQLRQHVNTALAQQVDLLTGIQWEDWLCVSVGGHSRAREANKFHTQHWGSDLSIKVTCLKRGIDPKTGRAVTINNNGLVVDFPQPSKLLDRLDQDVYLGNISETAYIQDTEKNRRALDDIQERMGLLRQRLADLLSQGSITQSLDNFKLLPAALSTKDNAGQ